jgi:hypothetical protein
MVRSISAIGGRPGLQVEHAVEEFDFVDIACPGDVFENQGIDNCASRYVGDRLSWA